MLGGPGRLRYGAALPLGTVMKAPASLAFLLLLGSALAQDQAMKPGSAYRSDIDAIVAALRHSAAEQHLPALGGDVATTAKILVAMANCHRRYHISDGPVVRPSVEFLRGAQAADGTFGDAATTGWVVKALELVDPDGSRDPVLRARTALAAQHASADPFAPLVAAIPQTSAAKAGGEAQKVGVAFAADPAKVDRSKVADALLQLVACQVASREPEAAPAAGPAPQAPAAQFTPDQQRAYEWLLSQQKNGLFAGGSKQALALTGFGQLALQSKPKAQRSPAEQAAIDAGMKWLLANQNEDGTWGEALQNYTTCVVVGALVAWGGPGIEPALAKAQKAILSFQHCEQDGYQKSDRDYGSVGYGGSQRGDLSNLHFALQALRQTGLPAQDDAFQRAVVFLQRTQNRTATNDFAGKVPDPDKTDVMLDVTSGDDGGASYYPGNSSAGYIVRPDGKAIPRSYGSMTYALLKSYSLAGMKNDDPRMQAAIRWISDNWDLAVNPGVDPALGDKARYQGLFYYYLMMAQALDQCGVQTVKVTKDGKTEEIAWGKALRAQLMSLQKPDGTWVNDKNSRWMEKESLLCTCYALLALQHCR